MAASDGSLHPVRAYLQDNFPDILVLPDVGMGLIRRGNRENAVHDRCDFAGHHERPDLIPELMAEHCFLFTRSCPQPRSLQRQAFHQHGGHIQPARSAPQQADGNQTAVGF